jgi:hypothetical protein
MTPTPKTLRHWNGKTHSNTYTHTEREEGGGKGVRGKGKRKKSRGKSNLRPSHNTPPTNAIKPIESHESHTTSSCKLHFRIDRNPHSPIYAPILVSMVFLGLGMHGIASAEFAPRSLVAIQRPGFSRMGWCPSLIWRRDGGSQAFLYIARRLRREVGSRISSVSIWTCLFF